MRSATAGRGSVGEPRLEHLEHDLEGAHQVENDRSLDMPRDADRYEHFYAHVDLLIIGGGIAGLQAALDAGKQGQRVLLVEQTAHWGGRAPVDGIELGGKSADDWITATLAALGKMKNVTLRTRTMGACIDFTTLWYTVYGSVPRLPYTTLWYTTGQCGIPQYGIT